MTEQYEEFLKEGGTVYGMACFAICLAALSSDAPAGVATIGLLGLILFIGFREFTLRRGLKVAREEMGVLRYFGKSVSENFPSYVSVVLLILIAAGAVDLETLKGFSLEAGLTLLADALGEWIVVHDAWAWVGDFSATGSVWVSIIIALLIVFKAFRA